MKKMTIIGIITDFGPRGAHYVAEMKGVAYQINPEVQIVDITHHITPFSVREAAYVLRTVYDTFPKGTIFVTVVDPGVGSNREILAVQTVDDYIFIGPNNGIFSYLKEHDLIAVSLKIEEEDFFYPPFASLIKERRKHQESIREIEQEVNVPEAVNIDFLTQNKNIESKNFGAQDSLNQADLWAGTFHGRDIMIPVASHLAAGLEFFSVGSVCDDIYVISDLSPSFSPDDRFIQGRIQYIDSFGNLITNIPIGLFFSKLQQTAPFIHLHFKEREYQLKISRIFAGHPEDLLLFVEGSSGFMEIALNQNSAQAFLGAEVEDELKIEMLGGLFHEFAPQL